MKFYHFAFFVLLSIIVLSTGCGTSKDTASSRGMQNLTSRYNILYNANILLEQSIRDLDAAYPEDYGNLLSVYKEPTEAAAQSISGNLDSVQQKAKTIIDEKLYSSYVDDAYFLIAQANYYKARFFTAAEFFTYVFNSYPDSKLLRQKSSIFQARSILQLDNFQEAGPFLDTAFKHLNDTKQTKRTAADLYATTAQYLIKMGKELQAIDTLEKAIHAKGSKKNRIRWTFVLAQLQERNKQFKEAYQNYTAVVKSNAPFDMAFNAGLNRISIEDASSEEKIDRIARLRSLLKDEKNKSFVDQIYYRIGDAYLDRNENHSAIKSYNTAIRLSTNNQNQKGLSYLRIADIYFRSGDYVAAKTYYDSTLSTLSPSFPGYDIISRKGNNLELLANRYRVIGREDTLQTLARLSKEERDLRIGALVREQLEKTQQLSQNNSAPESMIAAIDNPGTLGGVTEGKFYFNNTTAISQGLSDFRRRWGNRTLEDNWRRSGKTASEALTSVADNAGSPTNGNIGSAPGILTPEILENNYRNNLPLTDSALQASNQRVADSYYDIASFYRDELKDKAEAINAFEELLRRAPESSYKLSVYYNLYRLYSGRDEQKSEKYKNLILSGYPESPFARVIIDPDYSRKSNEKEAALNTAYNEIYDLYTEKKYTEVIQGVQLVESQYGVNVLSPQLAYLNALAVGHTQKLPPFESSLQKIVSDFSADKLITPLVQQHLSYINNNRPLFEDRPTALTEHNPFELLQTEPEPVVIAQNNNQNTAARPEEVRKPAAQPDQKPVPDATRTQVPETSVPPNPEPTVKPQTTEQPASAQPGTEAPVEGSNPAQPTPVPAVKPPADTPKPKPLFDLPPVGEYYFVINVQDPAANLNSSRFGIGQFNRTRFSGASIKHQLKGVNDENQLIFIGPFDNYDSAKYYERGILPLIKDIMKVPAEKYNTFVIVKQELDKLTSNTQINAYLDFYKNSR